MRWLSCVAVGLLIFGHVAVAQVNNDAHPNIVILYADDLGYGDVGGFNPASKIPTPNFDRLAAQGRRFTDAHSSSGICTPSRYALLTGRYHWRKFHEIVNSYDPSVFGHDELTIATMLKSRGYATACVGKWHLGWDWDALRKDGVEPRLQGRTKVYGADDLDWSRPIPDGPWRMGSTTTSAMTCQIFLRTRGSKTTES